MTETKTIVMVDDNNMMLYSMEHDIDEIMNELRNTYSIPKRFEINIVSFTDPRKALQYIVDKKYVNILITDNQMNFMYGTEFAKEVRKLTYNRFPIILKSIAPELVPDIEFFDYFYMSFDSRTCALLCALILLGYCS